MICSSNTLHPPPDHHHQPACPAPGLQDCTELLTPKKASHTGPLTPSTDTQQTRWWITHHPQLGRESRLVFFLTNLNPAKLAQSTHHLNFPVCPSPKLIKFPTLCFLTTQLFSSSTSSSIGTFSLTLHTHIRPSPCLPQPARRPRLPRTRTDESRGASPPSSLPLRSRPAV